MTHRTVPLDLLARVRDALFDLGNDRSLKHMKVAEGLLAELTAQIEQQREGQAVEEGRITDALGFPLKVKILVGDFDSHGRHATYEEADSGLVSSEAEHRIEIAKGLSTKELASAVAHEVYHLFFSVRHLITADEETQAEVFGDLVRYIYGMAATPQDSVPAWRQAFGEWFRGELAQGSVERCFDSIESRALALAKQTP